MKKVTISALLAALLVLSLGPAALASGEEFAAPAAAEEDVPWQGAAIAPDDPAVLETADAGEAEGEGAGDVAPAPDMGDTTRDSTAADTDTSAPEQTAPPDDRPDGWNYIDGYWYYYVSGYKAVSSWEQDGGGLYYVDGNGRMVAGFQQIGGSTYYFNEKHNGAYGAMKTGWQSIGGVWYYFESTGEMVTSDWRYDGKSLCYLNEDGHMATGLTVIGEDTYYFNEKHNGSYGAMKTGWQNTSGHYYYFAPDGAMVTSSWEQDGGDLYYLGEDGRMVTGIVTVDGVVRYFNETHDGAYGAVRTGWQSSGGYYYYFEPEGGMATSAWRWDGGSHCYLGEDGRMVTGWQTIDGVTYYFNERHNGSYGACSSRPTYIGSDMYMFGTNGALVTNSDVTLLGKTWHVDENGVIEGYVTDAGRKAIAVLDQVGWNLRSAFSWSVRLTYYNRWMRAPAGAVHTEWYANYGFDNHRGNCFVMNSTLYQMIKMLGYEVYFVEGGVLNSNGYLAPHGWTEVYHDGVQYVYDANFTNETGMNGYHIKYGQPGTWRYASYKRVD